ncbi:MAG TPA: sugar transferase [Pyrinomonadaceae bacterium]|nr:sugar transferase [Pyrinomonadaceae bacterium]
MKAESAIRVSTAATRAENRVPVWVMPLIKAGVAAADAALALACFVLAFKFRAVGPVLSPTAWAWSREFVPYAGILFFAIFVRLAMLIYERVYRFHGAFSYTREAIKVFKAVSVSSLLIIAWAFLFRGGFAFREFSYSRSVFVFDFVFALVIFVSFHLTLRAVQTQFRSRDINLIPTLIVGTNIEAVQTMQELRLRRDLGYRVIGVVSPDAAAEVSFELENEIVGGLDELPDLIRKLEIQEVIITDDSLPSERLFESMMQVGRNQKVEFRFAPSLFNLLPQKTSVDQIGVLPMVRLFREPLSEVQRFTKRAADIVLSGIALIVLSPVWLILTIIIKRDSPGPALFRQERVGMDGRIFLCYKFRTMRTDSDEALHREAYQQNIGGDEYANAGDDAKPVFGKVRNDPRITRAGRWLRRSSLDEMPQFLNVLKGDMSMVGPRPPIPYEVEEYDIWHRKRLDMKPGITGLWQVSGRNRLPFDEMVRIDLYYIENWSFWFDVKIMLLTLPAVLRGDGAR